jgi:uncharacterized membrane protein YfcA
MDGSIVSLIIFLAATFVAALVVGLAGFAFGLVAAAAWLHVLTPVQSTALIVAYGLLVQGMAVWKLRQALSWRRLWPFLLGGALGVPIGAAVLAWADPVSVRRGIGALLVVYSLYGLARPALKPLSAGAPADLGVGFANGVVGGLTGLAGIVVTIWCGLRGWPKDVQRTVFQPVGVFVFALTALWIGASGAVSSETAKLFVYGLPFLIAGTWLGFKLYGRLDEAGFRRVVLVLLLISGLFLVAPTQGLM